VILEFIEPTTYVIDEPPAHEKNPEVNPPGPPGFDAFGVPPDPHKKT
jgi:hypothetical protein